ALPNFPFSIFHLPSLTHVLPPDPSRSLAGLALFAIAAFFTFAVPAWNFISARNLSLLMIDFSITATLAIGMLLVILPGHIDLSAGSGVGLIGGIAAVATMHKLGV